MAPKRQAPRRQASAAELAVERFNEADRELHEFMEENQEFTDELRRLVENYNSTLKESVLSLKGTLKNIDQNKLVIGRFGVTKKSRDYWDAEELAALLPAIQTQHFLRERIVWEVNETKLEQMIRQGDVDRDMAFRAFHREEPTVALMPGAPKEKFI